MKKKKRNPEYRLPYLIMHEQLFGNQSKNVVQFRPKPLLVEMNGVNRKFRMEFINMKFLEFFKIFFSCIIFIFQRNSIKECQNSIKCLRDHGRLFCKYQSGEMNTIRPIRFYVDHQLSQIRPHSWKKHREILKSSTKLCFPNVSPNYFVLRCKNYRKRKNLLKLEFT